MKQQITLKYTEKPTETDFAKYNEFAAKNWGKSNDSAEDAAKNFFDKNKSVVTAYINYELVGLCFIHFRTTNFNGKNISFAGIGGVVTHKEFRHKGIATKLLQEAIQKMQDKVVDIALLATDIPRLGKLYSIVGFVPLKNTYVFDDINDVRKPDPGGMIAPICSPEIYSEIVNSPEALFVGKSAF